MKRLLALAVLLSAAAPAIGRADHCNEINIYSSYSAAITEISYDATSWMGCGLDENTDYLLPGASGVMVFVRSAERPIDGALEEGGNRIGSVVEMDGVETLLRFTRGENAQGDPANFWYSQTVPLEPARSIQPGSVTATACYDLDRCVSRTYRTVTA